MYRSSRELYPAPHPYNANMIAPFKVALADLQRSLMSGQAILQLGGPPVGSQWLEIPEASAPLKLGQKIHRKMVPIMAKQSEV